MCELGERFCEDAARPGRWPLVRRRALLGLGRGSSHLSLNEIRFGSGSGGTKSGRIFATDGSLT
jgi:hypothetical protein